jgi:hypothetical protein
MAGAQGPGKRGRVPGCYNITLPAVHGSIAVKVGWWSAWRTWDEASIARWVMPSRASSSTSRCSAIGSGVGAIQADTLALSNSDETRDGGPLMWENEGSCTLPYTAGCRSGSGWKFKAA